MTSWETYYKKIDKEVNALINDGFLENQEESSPNRIGDFRGNNRGVLPILV